MNRYNLESDNFGVHQKIIKTVGKNKQVLDIGCASGYLARQMKKRNCLVTGVEVDKKSAKKAQKYCRKVIIGDIEDRKTLIKIGKKEYDVILATDVLEHLENPGEVLKNLAVFMKKNSRLIISVPNIAFLTNRLLLLLGKFEYTSYGIMDLTHLRFFTKKTILKIVEKEGYKVEKLDFIANFTQLPFFMKTLHPIFGRKTWWRKLEYKITSLWPEGLAIQFLLVCRKR